MGYLFTVLPRTADEAADRAKLHMLAAMALQAGFKALSECISLDTVSGQLFSEQAGLAVAADPDVLLELKAKAQELHVDVIMAKRLPHLQLPGGIIMDMDMTSVTIEGIDEIARALGVYEQVAALTAAAMHGKADFATSLRRRVALLQGGSAQVLTAVKARMQETPGLNTLLTTLQQAGFKCAIASGGFTQLIAVLEHKYHLDLVRANTLEIKDGCFTGKVVGPIVDAAGKQQALCELCSRFNIDTAQTIAIGDGANDLQMILAAGFGLAYHAKPAVVAKAPAALHYCDLSALALLLTTYASRVPAHG